MRRWSRKAYASMHTRCVVQIGRRIGAACGSEKAGGGRAVLLAAICLVVFGLFFFVELVPMTGVLSAFLAPFGAAPSPPNRWGSFTTTTFNFEVRSFAFRDMSEKDKQREHELHVRRVEEWLREAQLRPSADAALVVKGETDPNAFRMTVPSGGAAVQPVDAVVDGVALVRRPGTAPLPRLRTMWRIHTATELYELYDALDIIYSFVNGSEANHHYRKQLRADCGAHILRLEKRHFLSGNASAALPSHLESEGKDLPSLLAELTTQCPIYRSLLGKRNGELLKHFGGAESTLRVDDRDRETDELRHSLRSVEQHMPWHRGRVVMVSPGHHPTWVDGAKNFLAGMCGDARVQALRTSGTHLRVTTVHQDAVMPYGMRLTVDSHVIEQHLWRVRNVTPVHVYMNDDYFVNRDVAITDLLNEYGGTIVRTEGGNVAAGFRGDSSISWIQGVANTELFNIVNLEHLPEDFIPKALLARWRGLLTRGADKNLSSGRRLFSSLKAKVDRAVVAARLRGIGLGGDAPAASKELEQEARYILAFSEMLGEASTSSYWDAAFSNASALTLLPAGRHRSLLKHYLTTHAPFVYCTNMFRHWSVRFRDDFAYADFHHRQRKARDLFIPFLYNAFIMARPWQASPKFLPYLLELKEAMEVAAAETSAVVTRSPHAETHLFIDTLRERYTHHFARHAPNVSIFLDNNDGCAPATLYRNPAAEVMYMRVTNDIAANKRIMDDIKQRHPLYFNANAGFNTAEAADQLRRFLQSKFPMPVYLEVSNDAEVGDGRTRAAAGAEDGALWRLFGDLMALPVVGVVSYEEGVCPLVRSLALAFAGHHRGVVQVSVEQHGGATLREARAALRHRVVSAMPAPACRYSERVSVGSAARGDGITEVARRAIGGAGAGVVLPSTCGGGAGLRVRGFVVDARTPGAPVRSAAALRDALAVPAQTLSLEDFRAVAVGPSEGDVVLVVSRADADAKAVHWVNGASESDLLVTYPLPVEAYEDMSAEVRWSVP
ncbi:hypothetical protein CUR178_05695 [Leishmania enriettii]|uniref:Stealth protein CR3 conserved region 3 domain-containing protein n=1 Tax=Leishmania enriettii TaxID=5663 RepID=A0A836KTU6_LEIEN|nr:hypothetical protein CUR178_05695 [Leishmania enriettii]